MKASNVSFKAFNGPFKASNVSFKVSNVTLKAGKASFPGQDTSGTQSSRLKVIHVWKLLVERSPGRQNLEQRLARHRLDERHRLDDQPVAFLSQQDLTSWKLAVTRDSDRLVAPVAEQARDSFSLHNVLLAPERPMLEHRLPSELARGGENLSPEEYRQRVAELVDEIELEARVARMERGTSVLGVGAVLRQRPHTRPSKTKRSPAPRFHAASKAVRNGLREAYHLFLAAFRDAAELLKSGDRLARFPVDSFPPGLPFVRALPP